VQKQTLDPRQVATAAVMTAVVFAVTLAVRINTPIVGYIHLGDAPLFFAAFAFGPWIGAIAGGLGTALADIAGGFPQWALISFLVHGLQGLLVGAVFFLTKRQAGSLAAAEDSSRANQAAQLAIGIVLGVIAGGVVVVAGYYLGGIALVGKGEAVLEVPFNTVQVLAGSILGIILYLAVRRAYPPLMQR
jgi:uncharacterized membrane protein